MGLFSRKEVREDQTIDNTAIEDPILKALLGKDEIDRSVIMNIPAVSACISKIADTVSSLEVKLYKRTSEGVEEVTADVRPYLLNAETGDTLDGAQFKRAMIEDMYLEKGGYAYVNKVGGKVQSIHYVEAQKIAFQYNTDPIFKDYQIQVNGKTYEGWQFIKLLRNTRNGFKGTSIINESSTLLNIVYSTQLFEKNMVKTGGNKKGFIQATNRLTKEAMTALKDAFRKLYANNTENVVVLNDGLKFQESSNTSVELQLNENKETNNNDVCKLFLMPPPIINGNATEQDEKLFNEGCILPVLEKFEKALNSVLLNEDEKDTMFFAFDTTDLLKGDIEKRYRAFEIACKNGWMQVDEIRQREKLPVFGLDFIKLGLQDVLYYPKTNEIYTPNTNKISKMNEEGEVSSTPEIDPDQIQKGGENEDEN